MAPREPRIPDAREDAFAADLAQLRRLEPAPQSHEERRRVIDGVIEQAARQAGPPRPATWTRTRTRALARRTPVVAVMALAAAAVLALWHRATPGPQEPAQTAATVRPQPLPALRLTSGRVEVDGQTRADKGPIEEEAVVDTLDGPAKLLFADASILRAGPRTRLVYRGDPHHGERIELRQGSVSLRVTPRSPQAGLHVETAELSAQVVGTRFEVVRELRDARAQTTVRVHEGRVRVVGQGDGRARMLAAGAQITVRAAEPTPEPTAVHGTDTEPPTASDKPSSDQPSSDQPSMDKTSMDNTSLGKPATETVQPPKTARASQALSGEIRRELRQGEVASARRLLQRAEREASLRRVELALLQAEADMAEHQYGRAKSRYLALMAHHPASPEAELALFAAAQLSSGQAGVDLLQRYLARYPDGRFAQEAQRLLQALDRP